MGQMHNSQASSRLAANVGTLASELVRTQQALSLATTLLAHIMHAGQPGTIISAIHGSRAIVHRMPGCVGIFQPSLIQIGFALVQLGHRGTHLHT